MFCGRRQVFVNLRFTFNLTIMKSQIPEYKKNNLILMSKKILFAAALFFAITASAQKKIEISELPQPARDFIEKHFKGISVDKVKKDAEHGEKGYEVILGDGTELEFWKDGSYREVDGKDKAIPTAFIDPKIVAYVEKHYPKRKITHIDYGHKDVDVDLTGDLDLEFTKEGTFIKGEKDD